MSNALSASQLPTLIARAEQAGGSWVVVVMASLPNCAWCDLVLRDQLITRMRSTQSPTSGRGDPRHHRQAAHSDRVAVGGQAS